MTGIARNTLINHFDIQGLNERLVKLFYLLSIIFACGGGVYINNNHFRLDVLFLGIYLFLSLFHKNRGLNSQCYVSLSIVLLISLILAFYINFIYIKHIGTGVSHDLVSYAVCLLVLICNDKTFTLTHELLHKAVIAIILLAMLFSSYSLFYNGINVLQGPSENFWIFSEFLVYRFRFMSDNPNQAALLFLCLPFYLLYAFRVQNKIRRSVFLSLFAFSFYIGLITLSKALMLAWVVSFCLLGGKYLFNRPNTSLFLNSLTIICFIMSIFFVYMVEEKITEKVNQFLTMHPLDYNHRLYITKQSMRGLEKNLLLGLGPGAHVEVESEISFSPMETYELVRYFYYNSSVYDNTVLKIFSGTSYPNFLKYQNVDALAPIEGMEAHNTLIDLMLQAGLLGLALYLFLHYRIFLMVRHSTYLLGIFVSLLIFSLFHFVLRQPIYWLMMNWIYMESVKANSKINLIESQCYID